VASSDGHELRAVDKFLTDNLRAETELTALIGDESFYSDVAPKGTPPPYVLHQFITGEDTNAIGAIRIFTKPLYLVKVVTEGESYKEAGILITLVERAIVGKQQVITIDGIDWQIMGCHRERPIRFPQFFDGVRYNHLGGQYRIFVHKQRGAP
jgi:hypothetical protein